MGGPRLTPEQIALAADVLARTANYSEAARAIGRDVATVRQALQRHRVTKNHQLHARACEMGLRRGRRSCDVAEQVIVRTLAGELTDGPGLEPKDIAGLAGALSRIVSVRVALAAREDQRRQSRLTRDKTRAEITRAAADTDLIRARIAGALPPDASVDALLRQLSDLAAGAAREADPGAAAGGPRPDDPGAARGAGEPDPTGD